jgi:4-amino-4-deoxy-L-arabinose transferase-like glycosyltransferase
LRLRRLATPAGAVTATLIGFTLLRLGFGAAIGLGIDESYMVAAGRVFRFGYFDHPPLAWWLTAGAARLFASDAAVVVRLPFIALFALSTWLMFRLGARLFGAWAGAWAAFALNLAPVFGVTSGGWVLPDGPLDCALLAAALALAHALDDGRWRWWLAAGAAAGLALLAKYTAVLTLAGALLYLATQPAHRRWLARPQPYAAVLLAGVVFAPVVAWNAAHGWASFAFQGGRAADGGVHPLGPLTVLVGEALFVLPWLWLPMMAAFVAALRAGPAAAPGWFCACLGAPPIVLFAVVALWTKHVMFHWAAPGYLMLFPLLGAFVLRLRPALRRGVAAATVALLVLGLAAVTVEVRWHVLPLRNDPGADALDWNGLRPALAARGLLGRPGTVIGATGWREAGKIDHALGGAASVICLSRDPREYGLAAPRAAFAGRDVVIVARRPVSEAALAREGVAFAALDPLGVVALAPAARPGLSALLYLGHDLRVTPPE